MRRLISTSWGREAVKLWAYVVWAYGIVMVLFPATPLGLATTAPAAIAAWTASQPRDAVQHEAWRLLPEKSRLGEDVP